MGIVLETHAAAVGDGPERQSEAPVDHGMVGVVPQRLLMGGNGLGEVITPRQPQSLIEELLREWRVGGYRSSVGPGGVHQDGQWFALGCRITRCASQRP